MGIIRKQSVQGAFIAYSGAALGFINVGLLFPHILNPSQVGLVNVLVAISTILAQFSTLGFVNVITRMFSYFRSPETKHHGFMSLTLVVSLLGFLLVMVIFQFYKPVFTLKNQESSPLLIEHLVKIIPLTFFTLLFLIFDNYCKVLYNSTIGIFLKELLFRGITLINLLLCYLGVYDFNVFLNIYIAALCLPAVILLVYLVRIGEFSLKTEWSFVGIALRKQIWMVALFGILSGFGAIAISNIDKYMVNSMLTLSKTGIYSISFFFGTLITIPARPLIKIASALIADAWKNNDTETIKVIYQKSCLNQYIVGILVYVGIVINLHNIFQILPPEYEIGKWVIVIVSLANLIEVASGTSGMIIQTSRYFKAITFLSFASTLILIVSGYLLIPKYGITGAAVAILITRLLFVLSKFTFIRVVLKFKGLNFKTLILTGIIGGLLGLNMLLPKIEIFYLDIIFRSVIISLVYLGLIYFFKFSEDVNEIINKTLIRLKIMKP